MSHKIFFLVLLFFAPVALLAHGSHGTGIMSGFTHPILGIDHAIAILGTGLLAFLVDKSKWYLVLGAFILAMIVGGKLGVEKEATYIIEKLIAISIMVIGLLVAYYKDISIIWAILTVAFFGFFHGYAHGAEMPNTVSSGVYISGYTLGALLMGMIGLMIGRYLIVNELDQNVRFSSGAFLGMGLVIFLS